MKEPFFKPYIGEGFRNPENNIFGGLKILALGHNHYCYELLKAKKLDSNAECGTQCTGYTESCHELTSMVVKQFIEYCLGNGEFSAFMNTYSKFANALTNYAFDRDTVWDNIAFYNYCQSAVSHDAELPGQDNYTNSQEAFIEVLKTLKPHVVICWSRELVYMNTPSNNWTAPDNGHPGYYTIDGDKIPMFAIHHPSWKGFSPTLENNDIKINLYNIDLSEDKQ